MRQILPSFVKTEKFVKTMSSNLSSSKQAEISGAWGREEGGDDAT